MRLDLSNSLSLWTVRVRLNSPSLSSFICSSSSEFFLPVLRKSFQPKRWNIIWDRAELNSKRSHNDLGLSFYMIRLKKPMHVLELVKALLLPAKRSVLKNYDFHDCLSIGNGIMHAPIEMVPITRCETQNTGQSLCFFNSLL